MAETHFTGGNGALWVQTDGPNTRPEYLGCHAIGDIDEPQGDVEVLYCKAPTGPNQYRPVGQSQGAAGAVTATLTADITEALDPLERIRCPATLFVNMVTTGRMDVFTNWSRQFVLFNATVTSRGLAGLAARTQDDSDRAEQTFDLSGEALLRLLTYVVSRQAITEPENITDITFCNEFRCASSEQPAADSCQSGFASCAATAAGTANVLRTDNGGTWTATDNDPFIADEDIHGVECFELGGDTVRVVVGRGTTDAGSPAEIAYSDDDGTTWTTVNVGDIVGQFIPTGHSLAALDRNNSWVVTDDGYIYFSGDACLSWTIQSAAVLTSGALNCIRFVDQNVGWVCGDTNTISRSVDGGNTWSSITGPAAEAANNALVVEPINRNKAWVGYDSGRMYYTEDGGSNWYERSFSGSGVGVVCDIRFANVTQAFMLREDAGGAGYMLWSTDGGYTWTNLTIPTNSGVKALAVCDQWKVYAAGDAHTGSGFIAQALVG